MQRKLYKQVRIVATLLAALLFWPIVQAANVSPPTPEGMLPHFESMIALAIVLVSIATAWMLNHALPRARVFGTLLAALGCFGVVFWFIALLGTGVMEDPKPHQAPMDAAKPALMWIQAGIALVAGISLLAVANRQRKSSDLLHLLHVNEPHRYGRMSRLLHWATAILMIIMIPMGIFFSMIPEDVWYRTEYSVVHKTIGIIIFGLLIFRLFWNTKSKRPALDASLTPTERKMAHGAHVALYGLLFALPVTGYVMTSLHGYPSYLFTLELQPFLDESDADIYWGLFHKYLLPYFLYIVLGAHILGALKHQFIDKHENAFKRMVN
ncbi:MAG: cytochrome b/b6 domain-containing protein [Gammaproteobacteria bacterium]|nr:cytochrome b/b6 domain-containing protein [Gammaproteobacteria bacterium]